MMCLLQWKKYNTTLSKGKIDVNLLGFIVPQWRWIIGEEGLFFVFFSSWCVGSSKKGMWVLMLLEIISCFMIRMKVLSLQLIQNEKIIISLYVVNGNKDKILVLHKFMFFTQRPFTHLVLSSCFLVAYR